MAKPKTLRPPALLLHKQSGRAFVMTRDEHGNRIALFLGEHGTPQAERAYRAFLSDFYAGHPARRPAPRDATKPGQFTVENLCTEFLVYAEQRYRRPDGTTTQEPLNFAHAFRHLLKLYRDVAAEVFDVVMLDAVRMDMIRDDLARTVINSRMGRIRRAFAWGASRKLLGASGGQRWHELKTLAALRPGEFGVREAPKVPPVPWAEVEEILPHLAPQLAAMVRLQVSTGARPGEVCGLRMSMIDRTDPEAWIYRPAGHKTAWRGHDRTIPLLPADQQVLQPFLRLDDLPLFSPRDAEGERGRKNAAEDVGDTYGAHSYARGIARGVQAANAVRVRRRLLELLAAELSSGAQQQIEALAVRRLIAESGLLRKDIAATVQRFTGTGPLLASVLKDLEHLPLLEPWGANRLRHLAATRAAAIVGDDGVQLLLGHADGRTLKHYVQRDPKRVVDVRRRLLPG